MPTVSAIIPTFNRAHFVSIAINSVLAQSRPADEIIVVDDGSTDNTAEVMADFGSRVRYVRQLNSGPSAARNHGMRVASSDYIAFLDSDDIWTTDRLERQVAAISQDARLDLVFGLEAKFSGEVHFERSEIKDRDVLECLNSVDCVVPDPFALLLKENFIPTSTVLFRRNCIADVGFMDESLKGTEDYDFWLRFALKGFRFGFVNAVLARRRLHEGNLVNQWAVLVASAAEVLVRYRDHSPKLRAEVDRRLSDIHYDLGSYLLYRREYRLALSHLKQVSPKGTKRMVWAGKLLVANLLAR
jgi:glycosyltransferase involved in cell wall biosynthesis